MSIVSDTDIYHFSSKIRYAAPELSWSFDDMFAAQGSADPPCAPAPEGWGFVHAHMIAYVLSS